MRIDKNNYYLDIAESILERSTCLRRHYGAVIVKNDEIISTGYNGAPRGRANCTDLKKCVREENNVPSGEKYELCRSVHAEQNAIISASRKDLLDSTLYLTGKEAKSGKYTKYNRPCTMCTRFIINAGIKQLVIRDDKTNYHIINVSDYIKDDDTLPKETIWK